MKIKKYIIELNDIHLYAYHGVMPQENKVGAWYTLNLRATIAETSSITSDNIDDTVNYAGIYDTVCEEMKTPSKLLEHVCGRILAKLFDRFETIEEIGISLAKDTPPLGGDRMNSCVKITATR